MSGNVMELRIGRKRVILCREEDGGYRVYVDVGDEAAYSLASTSSRDIALYAFHQAYRREQEDWLAMRSSEVFL